MYLTKRRVPPYIVDNRRLFPFVAEGVPIRLPNSQPCSRSEGVQDGTIQGKTSRNYGGTSGIGLTIAKLLLDHGARVLVTGRKEATLGSAREELGPNAIVVKSNAASVSDISKLAARMRSEFETLDGLLVCAGQPRFVPFESVTEAIYHEMLAVNAKARISLRRSLHR